MMLEPMDTKKTRAFRFSKGGPTARISSPANKKKHERSVSLRGVQLRVLARQPNDEGMSDDGMKRLGELVGGGS